eukprot:Awhi_evm1s5327
MFASLCDDILFRDSSGNYLKPQNSSCRNVDYLVANSNNKLITFDIPEHLRYLHLEDEPIAIGILYFSFCRGPITKLANLDFSSM